MRKPVSQENVVELTLSLALCLAAAAARSSSPAAVTSSFVGARSGHFFCHAMKTSAKNFFLVAAESA